MTGNPILCNNEIQNFHVNRSYKDCLFRMIFSEKRDLLELYNAINGTHYQNPEDLTYYTLEDAIYISFKNDISFLLGESLSLYEHQSTLNPNMPIRGFLYFARNYEAYIERNHLDIYSRVLQELPFPQYIVFYNGTTAAPERQTLCLTQAFKKYPEKTPCLECKAVLLNINYGKNQKIMKHCRKLKEYALFVNKMRSFLKKGLSVEISAQKTISECISQHILEDFLVKHRAEVTSMVLSTFDQENHDRILREYSEKIGLQKGEFQGKTKNCIKVINNLLKKGMSLKDTSDLLDEPAETVSQIAEMIRRHPDADEAALYERLYPADKNEDEDF